MPAIADHPVETPQGPMRFVDFLDSDYSTSMGVVVVHQGKIVFEHYARMQPYEKPTMWSVSKVLVASLVSILEERGQVDIDQPIESYIPEMSKSAYAGTTVRNILDMATGIECPEEYYDRTSCFNILMQAMGETWWDANSPDNPYSYLAGLKAERYTEQGTSFDYGSVNTDILGWMVEKITGMPFQDALSREIWTKAGMESDAAYVAPRFGVPHWDGGFLPRMRDMARFGLLFTPSYTVVSDTRIISKQHIETLLNGGRPELLANARYPGWKKWTHEADQVKHNVYQWDLVWANGDIYKGGWAGQGLLVNPLRDLVAVYTGYFKDDEHSELPVLPRLREVLNGVFGAAEVAD
jgi:CubicO group peptidase (beta-lactamase class C family)